MSRPAHVQRDKTLEGSAAARLCGTSLQPRPPRGLSDTQQYREALGADAQLGQPKMERVSAGGVSSRYRPSGQQPETVDMMARNRMGECPVQALT